MLYLDKLLTTIKKDPNIFKSKDVILKLGLASGKIKDLKKYATENGYIFSQKQEYFLTQKGEDYLLQNSPQIWNTKEFPLRPIVNVEYLKDEKMVPVLSRAIRLLAKHLIEKEPLKEFSLEHALFEDIKKYEKLIIKLENELLNNKKNNLETINNKYLELGLTKSLISVLILAILVKNLDRVAIYEKSQFQLKFDSLMFDRMIACPENFEIQKTEIDDEFILKDVSKIILNKKSNNILEITKGLYTTIKQLDKYSMNTENLSKKTLRLRNIITNAKDPINLFTRDIPRGLSGKSLEDCDRAFLNDLKIALNELKNCTKNLTKELENFILECFQAKSKEELSDRFLAIKDFIGEKELKILYNNVIEINVSNDLWINRIATFINKFRVPKDWSDEDYANFKIKTKELALKFSILEATLGTNESFVSKNYHKVLNNFLNLTKAEKMILLRKLVNNL
ncbi:MAG: hypothetical protein E7Z92_06870 [Cyanobacteria bacterium SIG31]|nr:hypothetical protein [Cyanobacteria bacterium SIG31]